MRAYRAMKEARVPSEDELVREYETFFTHSGVVTVSMNQYNKFSLADPTIRTALSASTSRPG